ncbi:hypothetical protein B0H10DRAFT_2050792 [Mycena sp. CBHHK59/15]|nr:hypothetical protein B0H10DRAFT_2050792 [Mycena sp. CBHHK59/15]
MVALAQSATRRVVRYHFAAPPPTAQLEGFESLLLSLGPEMSENESEPPLTPEERNYYEYITGAVQSLEDVFSLRHKNRTSKTSTLFAAESARFHRALYRIMMYCMLFGPNSHSAAVHTDFGERIQQHRRAFLGAFSSAELYALHSTLEFLRELVNWVTNPEELEFVDGAHPANITLAAGPLPILAAFQTRTFRPIADVCAPRLSRHGVENTLFAHALADIWEERGKEPPSAHSSHWRSILDDVVGERDECSQCGAPDGVALWCPTNWHLLWGTDAFGPRALPAFLPGNLKHNPSEATTLRTLTTAPSFEYPALIADLYDFGVAGWARDAPLCDACLSRLLATHLHLWLFARRSAEGWAAPADCWYGYDCHLQMINFEHAQVRNHLCAPLLLSSDDGNGAGVPG